jgi:RNA polymerase sigma-70 factor, ECF subfamily
LQELLTHLDAAWDLARWLVGSDADAEDVLQEALLRAHRFGAGVRPGSERAWFLQIVRNASYDLLRRRKEFVELGEAEDEPAPDTDPSVKLDAAIDAAALRAAIAELRETWREVLVLRELEGLSYEEIAQVAQVPVGTVMSRLHRARALLKAKLVRRSHGAR